MEDQTSPVAGVLIPRFVLYGFRVSTTPAETPHLVGPARLLDEMPDRKRRIAVASLLQREELFLRRPSRRSRWPSSPTGASA